MRIRNVAVAPLWIAVLAALLALVVVAGRPQFISPQTHNMQWTAPAPAFVAPVVDSRPDSAPSAHRTINASVPQAAPAQAAPTQAAPAQAAPAQAAPAAANEQPTVQTPATTIRCPARPGSGLPCEAP